MNNSKLIAKTIGNPVSTRILNKLISQIEKVTATDGTNAKIKRTYLKPPTLVS